MKASKQNSRVFGLFKGIVCVILVMTTLILATGCEKNVDQTVSPGRPQEGKKVGVDDVDWDANLFSLDGVDPSSVNGSYAFIEKDGDYMEVEEIILWNGTYLYTDYIYVDNMRDLDHSVLYDGDILSKGYYILRGNSVLYLYGENDGEIKLKSYYFFVDNNLVYEYYDDSGEYKTKIYEKQ